MTGTVRVEGWAELDAALHRLALRGETVTAVGLNLSNYDDAEDGAEWWDKEPLVEVCAYDDGAYPFSTASDDDIRTAGERYAAPWTGCMTGDMLPHLTVHGLRDLNGPLLRDQPGADDPRWAELRTGFTDAVAGVLAERGLALEVPLVLGEHDVGPWWTDVARPARVSDHLVESERIIAAQDAANRARYDAITEQTVAELAELRDGLRGWGFRNRDKRRTLSDYADAKLAMICRATDLEPPTGSLARMSDAELGRLADSYRSARDARARR